MTQTQMDSQAQRCQNELTSLTRRDVALWLFCGSLIVLLCTAFFIVLLPNIVSHSDVIAVDVKNLPQLSIGLFCLVALFGVQINRQRRELTLMRDALFRRLIHEERKSDVIIDPETQTYSTVMLQSALEKMSAEAAVDNPLSILDVQLQSLAQIRKRNGDPAVDHLTRSLAEILRSSLRGSDRIFRNGSGSFTVLMPNTPGDRAAIPVQRIEAAVERWNGAMNLLDYKLKITATCSTCTEGESSDLEMISQVREGPQSRPMWKGTVTA